ALSLTLTPSSLRASATYTVSGTLTDLDAKGVGISTKTIAFKATSPISVPSTTTSSTGNYLVGGLKAPSTKGSYTMQSQFAGDSLFGLSSSIVQTLKVT